MLRTPSNSDRSCRSGGEEFGISAAEPAPSREVGFVEHDATGDDSYDVLFRTDPEVVFFGGRFPSPDPSRDKAWLLEISGRHGPGPYDNGPFGRHSEDFRIIKVGNAFVDDFGAGSGCSPVPAAIWLLAAGLGALGL